MATLPERPAKRAKSPKSEYTATHIPWEDIFKCHISVIEGHVRMLEMIQQHTEPETENWNVIIPMVERAREMVKHSKAAAALTTKGATTGDGTDGGKDGGAQKAQANVSTATPSQGVKQSSSKKRAIADNSPGSAPAVVSRRTKKLRTRKEVGDNDATSAQEKGSGGSNNHQKPVVEFEDISAEVDATLREKEERRRRKAEKKRGRESGGSTVANAANENGESASRAVWEKPKKKAKKDTTVNTDVETGVGEAETGNRGKRTDVEEEDEDTEVRTKKRQKRD
ncbi:MAG: hypothetical protein M1840_007156 [Geoglossum simile]|nr:MAG: hypothetical protein M1840_007156 [Geoglossum simile]